MHQCLYVELLVRFYSSIF